MNIEEIYKQLITNEEILTLTQLAKLNEFGSKRYDNMRRLLYEKYGKSHVKSICSKRLGKHANKIRNSKNVKYSEASKQKMKIAQKQSWKNSGIERRNLSRENLKNFAEPKASLIDARKKAVDTRRNNGWPGHTEKWRRAVSEAAKTRTISDETRTKMRLAAIKRLQREGQKLPNYNSIACKIFDQLNEILHWKGNHAENGGELFLDSLGYWVDFYEPTLNLVIEFDEVRHKYDIERDKKRENEIRNSLNCKFLRINENQTIEEIIYECKRLTEEI